MKNLISRKAIKGIQKQMDYFELPESCSKCYFARKNPLTGWECMMGIAVADGIVSGGDNIECCETEEPFDFRPEWCYLNPLLKENTLNQFLKEVKE